MELEVEFTDSPLNICNVHCVCLRIQRRKTNSPFQELLFKLERKAKEHVRTSYSEYNYFKMDT